MEENFNIIEDGAINKGGNGKIIPAFLFASLLVTGIFSVLFFNFTGAGELQYISVEIGERYSRKAMEATFGPALGWPIELEKEFSATLRRIQWDTFNANLTDSFSEEYNWADAEKELFLTQAMLFLNFRDDLLEDAYIPGEYTLVSDSSPYEVAESLMIRIKSNFINYDDFLNDVITQEKKDELSKFIVGQVEQLPDLIPLPAQEISIRKVSKKSLLVFNTTYYNIGIADLKLIGDPKKVGAGTGTDKVTFQRIDRSDGEHRDIPVGEFHWHNDHLHYHLSDFINYTLTPLSAERGEGDTLLKSKATFCIRDVSRITGEGFPTSVAAKYLVCGNEIQGVSVGWGDTYFNTFSGQDLDITDLRSGRYKLTFVINPEGLLKESTYENNTSWVALNINKEKNTVEVLSYMPENFPGVEHIYKVR